MPNATPAPEKNLSPDPGPELVVDERPWGEPSYGVSAHAVYAVAPGRLPEIVGWLRVNENKKRDKYNGHSSVERALEAMRAALPNRTLGVGVGANVLRAMAEVNPEVFGVTR